MRNEAQGFVKQGAHYEAIPLFLECDRGFDFYFGGRGMRD